MRREMNPLELSPEHFRDLAAQVVALSAHYLASLDSLRTFPLTDGVQAKHLFSGDIPEHGMGDQALAAVSGLIEHSRAQNGRFFGYVLGSAEPVAALGDLVASMLNQNITAWRSAPAGVTIERTVVRCLAEAIGCPDFSGTLTGGGSSANLMALAMARESKLPANDRGIQNAGAGVVYASEQVHMSVPKAVAMLGIGRENVHYIPCDKAYRMIPSRLESAINEDESEGRQPLAVVVSAGTVNTGAIDPLEEIASIAHQHSLWMHVDGAYGALAAIAVPEKFRGLSLADSISLDAHKWLYQPLDCGGLLYRDPHHARRAFSYTGSYARQLSSDPIEGFAFFEESMELSRRFRALKLWLSLRYHGMGAFRQAIRQNIEQAQKLAEAIRTSSELELTAPVELSAVCFRHRFSDGASQELQNRFNLALLKRIVARGRIYLSNAELEGKFCLRACIVNHFTTNADVEEIVPEALKAATEISRDFG
jgi:glutamate/tyrosine decarboxylase-like PLP-dependent enzyme